MRLLRTDTLEFKEFFDERVPKYAILSHRWTDEEPTYTSFSNNSSAGGPGLAKIYQAAARARSRKLDWLWVDTICIDKTSSDELSEAINSMWHWYQSSIECYAYLGDVQAGHADESLSRAMADSEWFRRGWTLQELIAPKHVLFFNVDWHFLGTKRTLAKLLSRTTNIRGDFLRGETSIRRASIAMRMSWAAGRTTTRIEDEAYSLLGLFGVNMPLLYGERNHAFFRLQVEILRESDDESLFAWRASTSGPSGMLAPNPRAFKDSNSIQKMELGPEMRVPWSWTNRGLEIRILTPASKAIEDPMPPGRDNEVLHLGCFLDTAQDRDKGETTNGRGQEEPNQYIAISLQRFGNSWYRTNRDKFVYTSEFAVPTRHSRVPLVYRYYYVPQAINDAVVNSKDKEKRKDWPMWVYTKGDMRQKWVNLEDA